MSTASTSTLVKPGPDDTWATVRDAFPGIDDSISVVTFRDDTWATVRDAFPILQEVVYLNVGTYGIMPEPVLQHFIETLTEVERSGVASNGAWHRQARETREKVAQRLHCAAANITFTGNATDGTNLVLAGLQWKEGDEVLTTDQEHEAIIHPLLHMQRCRGVQMRRVSISPDPQTMIDQLEAALSPRTRLIAFSHVTCETGTRLPAKEICAWTKERGLLSLLDGAQSLGAFDVDVGELGCDYFTSNGHKWLSGPKGTGIFYAHPERLLDLCPAHVGAGSLERADPEDGTAELWSTGRRFEFGTRAHALYAGLGASLDWLESVGWDKITARITELSDDLKQRILERPYLELLTPLPFDQSSGLIAFSVKGKQAGEVSTILRQKARIHVRVVPHYDAIRIATHCFVNEADLDKLMAVLDEIANS
jgi:selenocysteine lyase/cysteine desulfurase